MRVTTLLPLNDNLGLPFPAERIDAVLTRLTRLFNGCTIEGKVEGRSMHGDVEHRDELLRVTIIADANRLSEIREQIVEIGRELNQKTMYVEVRQDESVQFLSTD